MLDIQGNGGILGVQHPFEQHLACEPGTAEIGDQQSRHARSVRAGHRRALEIAVGVVGPGIIDLAVVIVSTGRGNVHPVSVAGIIGTASVGADGAHCDSARIFGRRTPGLAIVAGGEEADTARHGTDLLAIGVQAGILVKVIDGRFQGRSIFPGIRLQEKLMAFPGFLVLVGAIVIAEIIAPAVVAEDGAMVRSPFDGVFETAAAFA